MRGVVIGAVSAVAVLGVGAAVAVPEAQQWYEGRHEQTSSYATGSKAKDDRPSVPRWLPDDASAVEYAMRTTGGQRLLKATLPGGRLPGSCTALNRSEAPAPEIKASWFPSGVATKAHSRCGTYYLALDGHTLYAWQTNEDWVKDNSQNNR
ncbi:hypothetical protein ACFVW8_12385 [Streptomyces sp. NPDC058221]|uniref:hypothetical protein n=1 Tax=Streptomyces sp. NPDC058221 TaxID=3346388 RepID=UPI0036E9A3BC